MSDVISDDTVTVIVELAGLGLRVERRVKFDARGGDPWTTANAEQAVAAGGREVLAVLTALYGDVRDRPDAHEWTILPRQEPRPLTGEARP